MRMIRTLIVLLLALASALAPVAGVAMAKPCTMTAGMRAGNPADCPCHSAMKDCASLPQCRTAAGCASQCFTAGAYLPPTSAQPALGSLRVPIAGNDHLASLTIKPPAPPPRG